MNCQCFRIAVHLKAGDLMKSILQLFGSVFAVGMIWAAPTQAALVGYWNFDEPAGDIAFDVTGNGNDGVILGATRIPGIAGGALSFDGNSEVFIDNNEMLNFVGGMQMTAMGWYNPSGDPTGICCGYIVGQRQAATWSLRDDRRDPNQLEMLVSPGFQGDGGGDGVQRPPLGEWHHIAAVIDKPNVRMYVDGVLMSEYTVDDAPLAGSGTPTRIGGSLAIDGGTVGLIDEVKIFDHALTQEEIEAAMTFIPEPTTFALTAIGLCGLIGFTRRRRRK